MSLLKLTIDFPSENCFMKTSSFVNFSETSKVSIIQTPYRKYVHFQDIILFHKVCTESVDCCTMLVFVMIITTLNKTLFVAKASFHFRAQLLL